MTTLLNVREVAERTKLSKSTLDKLRCIGGGPPYIRLGKRRIAYAVSDVETWLNARRHGSTAEYQAKHR